MRRSGPAPGFLAAALLAAIASGEEPKKFPGPWREVEGSPAHAKGGGNVSPAEIMGDPWVLPENGRFRMWFTTGVSEKDWGLACAESADGVEWQLRMKPGGVLEPCVLYDAKEKIYRMWYAGVGTKTDDILTFRIGYATSADGLDWKRHAEPVFDRGGAGSWEEVCASHPHGVADPKGGYHLFYYASKLSDWRDGIEMQKGHIGHAWSADGITWERNPANPIVSPRDGKWDAWTVGGPSALIKDGEFWLWYMGFESSDSLVSHIGVMKAPASR